MKEIWVQIILIKQLIFGRWYVMISSLWYGSLILTWFLFRVWIFKGKMLHLFFFFKRSLIPWYLLELSLSHLDKYFLRVLRSLTLAGKLLSSSDLLVGVPTPSCLWSEMSIFSEDYFWTAYVAQVCLQARITIEKKEENSWIFFGEEKFLVLV